MRKRIRNLSEDLNMLGLSESLSKLTENTVETVPDYIKSWQEAGYRIALVETETGAVLESAFELRKYPGLLQERVMAGGAIVGTRYSFKLHNGKLGGKSLTEDAKPGEAVLTCLYCGAETKTGSPDTITECVGCHQPINSQLAESVEYLDEGKELEPGSSEDMERLLGSLVGYNVTVYNSTGEQTGELEKSSAGYTVHGDDTDVNFGSEDVAKINGRDINVSREVNILSEAAKKSGKKSFRIQDDIGKAKYTVSFHDGVKTHKDGSPFYDIEIFRNKEKRDQFVNKLKTGGYLEESKSLSELNSQGEPVHEKKEMKCRHCGKPSEDGSGVCEACAKKYEKTEAKKMANYSWKGGEELWTAVRGKVESVIVMAPTPQHMDGFMVSFEGGGSKIVYGPDLFKTQEEAEEDLRFHGEKEQMRRRALELSEGRRGRGGKPLHESTPGTGRSLARAGLVKTEKGGFYGLEAKSGEQVAPTIYTWIDDEVNANGMIQVRRKDGSKGAIEAFIAEAEEKQPKVDKLLVEKKRRQELVRRRWMEGCNEGERSDRDYAFKPGMKKPEPPVKPEPPAKDEPPADDADKKAFLEARRGKVAEVKVESAEDEDYDDKVKRLAREAEDYYQKLNIVPDADDVLDDVISALADDAGVNFGDIDAEDVKRILSISNVDEAKKDGKFGVFVYKKGDDLAIDDKFSPGQSSYWDNKERAIQVGKQIAASLPAKTHYVEVWEKDADGLWGNTGKPLWKSDAVNEAKDGIERIGVGYKSTVSAGEYEGKTGTVIKLIGKKPNYPGELLLVKFSDGTVGQVPSHSFVGKKKKMTEADSNEHISGKYHELEYNGGDYKYSLGNMSDAGWFWDGTKGDNMMLLFLYRLVRSKAWTPELKKQLVDFKGLAEFYRKAKNNGDELFELAYAVGGDNVTFQFGNGYWEMFEDEIDYDKKVPTKEIEKKVQNEVKAWLKKDLPGDLAGFLDWVSNKEDFTEEIVEIWQQVVYEMAPMKSEERDESVKISGCLMTEESFRTRRNKNKVKSVHCARGVKRVGEWKELAESASPEAMEAAQSVLDSVENEFDVEGASDEVVAKISEQCKELKAGTGSFVNIKNDLAIEIEMAWDDNPSAEELQVIFVADEEGNVSYEYFGIIDYWQGTSWGEYPYRSHVPVPSAVEESGDDGFAKKVKAYHAEAEKYFHNMKIVADQEEILGYVMDALEGESGGKLGAEDEKVVKNILFGTDESIRAEIKKIGEAINAISGVKKSDLVSKGLVEDINNILGIVAKRITSFGQAKKLTEDEVDDEMSDMETLKSQVGDISDKLEGGTDVTVQDILPVISALIGVLESYIEVAQKILDAVGGEEALSPKKKEPTEEPGREPESNSPEMPSDLSQAVPPPGQESRQGRDNLQESQLEEGGSSKTITDKKGNEILVSYQTPVAAKIDGKYYRTDKNWSATTAKHIGQYLPGQGSLAKRKAEVKPQEWFDQLLKIGGMNEDFMKDLDKAELNLVSRPYRMGKPTNAEVLDKVQKTFAPDYEFTWDDKKKAYAPDNEKSSVALKKAGFGRSFTMKQADAVQSKFAKLYPGTAFGTTGPKELGEAEEGDKLKALVGKTVIVTDSTGARFEGELKVRGDVLGPEKTYYGVHTSDGVVELRPRYIDKVVGNEIWADEELDFGLLGKVMDEAKETSADKLAKKIKDEESFELVDIMESASSDDHNAVEKLCLENIWWILERELIPKGEKVETGVNVTAVHAKIQDWMPADNEQQTTDVIVGEYTATFKDDSQYTGRFVANGITIGGTFELSEITVGSDELHYFGP